ncbi:DUF6869 domain-containing protein [Stenotrophomonas sp. PD6]|uniref:DUF6869 domain-containing protein n=1 Tax=Stenotrophomonas sp. PD6 TaxID=3368612 RepID=UPI003BA21F4D
MEFSSRKALAKSWIELQGAPDDSALQRESQWSALELNMLCIEEPEQAWELVVEIFESSSDPWVFENLGAGPLEALLSLHGPSTLKAIESYTSKSSDFLGVVAHVWLNALPSDVAKRLAALGSRG